jgi:hypothetical protein
MSPSQGERRGFESHRPLFAIDCQPIGVKVPER